MIQSQRFKLVIGAIGLSMLLSSYLAPPLAAQTDGSGSIPPATPQQSPQVPETGQRSLKIPDPAEVQSNYPWQMMRKKHFLMPSHSTNGPGSPLPPAETSGATSPANAGDGPAKGNRGGGLSRPANEGPAYRPTSSWPTPAPMGAGPQVRYQNGARTIKVNEGMRDITIVEHPTTGIDIEIITHYGPEQMQALKRSLPELSDYIDLFPTEINNAEISLSIGVKSKFTALTPDQLKSENPDAYNVYLRYVQTGDQGPLQRESPLDGPRRSGVIK
jgi:hypothetical protein